MEKKEKEENKNKKSFFSLKKLFSKKKKIDEVTEEVNIEESTEQTVPADASESSEPGPPVGLAPPIKMAKAVEPEAAEKEKLGKKKFLLIVIPAILLIGISVSAGAFFFLTHRSPNTYWDEKEKIASITEIVGSRKCKLDKKKNTVTYEYKDTESAGADIEKYVKYLEDEKDFADISKPDIKDTKDTDSKKAVTHYELGADSDKKGKLLKATIDVKKTSYTIKLTTEKGTLEKKLAKIEKQLEKEREKLEKKETAEEAGHNFEEALDKILTLSQEQLGLDIPPEQLKFFPDKGRYLMKGNDYYKIVAYKNSETGVTIYAGSYLADCKSLSKFYKFNEQTNTCTKIK